MMPNAPSSCLAACPGGRLAQEYDSLPAGNWSFAVTATDAAGNCEAGAAAAAPWQIDMAAFVQITGGDAGAVISRRAASARTRVLLCLTLTLSDHTAHMASSSSAAVCRRGRFCVAGNIQQTALRQLVQLAWGCKRSALCVHSPAPRPMHLRPDYASACRSTYLAGRECAKLAGSDGPASRAAPLLARRSSASFAFGAVISSQAAPGAVPLECALQAYGAAGWVPAAAAFAACASPAVRLCERACAGACSVAQLQRDKPFYTASACTLRRAHACTAEQAGRHQRHWRPARTWWKTALQHWCLLALHAWLRLAEIAAPPGGVAPRCTPTAPQRVPVQRPAAVMNRTLTLTLIYTNHNPSAMPPRCTLGCTPACTCSAPSSRAATRPSPPQLRQGPAVPRPGPCVETPGATGRPKQSRAPGVHARRRSSGMHATDAHVCNVPWACSP